MNDIDLEIKLGFLDEAKEHLANSEQCFLNLEKATDDPHILEALFRLAHNLKGSSDAVGFTDLKDFTHKLESLLLKLKNKEIEVSAPVIDLLLRSNDYLIFVVETLKADTNASYANPQLLNELEYFLSGEPPVGLKEEVPAPQEASKVDPAFELNLNAKPAPEKPKSTGDESIRVSLSRIEALLNNIGEIVILQAVLSQQKHNIPTPFVQKTIDEMAKIIKETQELSMSFRMLPVKQTFQKMQRIVRDTSRNLGKQINFSLSGEETEMDKTVLEQLSDPLVHLIRNAVDHGIEPPDERQKIGKASQGHVNLSAYHRGDSIVIEIKDDGKGLDAEKLIAKAKSKGILPQDSNLSQQEAYQLIFAPGFSTKEEVTDVSGRGVGMDVVKTNIADLQGNIELETELGKGSCFKIILPLTLAIVDGMVVSLGDERYVIPLSQVNEFIRPQTTDINSMNQVAELLSLRGETLPIHRLNKILGRKPGAHKTEILESIALISRPRSEQAFAVLVDDVICQQQVVIKPLGNEVKGLRGLSGSAILGDGRPALILDLYELIKPFKRNQEALKHKTNNQVEAA